MKTTKLIIILFVSFFFSQEILAQKEKKDEKKSKLKIDASLRTRGEVINGYKSLPTENNSPNLVTSQQTRLNFGYENSKMKFYLSLQDARIWGEGDIVTGTGNFGNTASVDVFQAWASLKLSSSTDIKFGRQKLAVDGQRLIGGRGWNNNGLAYDAATLTYKKNGLSLNLVMSFNNQKYGVFVEDYDLDEKKMKSMNYLHISKKFNDDLYMSFLTLFTGFQPAGSPTIVQFKNTSGIFMKYDNKKIFAASEVYYQLGKTIGGQDVAAYLFNAEAGYNFGIPYIGAGIDYISGQSQDETEKYQAFDNFYGARFKFNGNLNYFVVPKSTKNGGLVNPFFKLGLKFNKKNSLTAYYHMFKTAQDVVNGTGENYDKNLGSEIDLIYTHKINKEIILKAGYHTAFVSETLESFKGVTIGESETPQWFWVMLTFKPTLFSSK